MAAWRVVYTKQAQKDAKKIAQSGLRPKAAALLEILAKNPRQNAPPFEKLVGDLGPAPQYDLLRGDDPVAASEVLKKRLVRRSSATSPRRSSAFSLSHRSRPAHDGPPSGPPLAGAFSRRINIQHRLVYQILDAARVVKVIRMWTHYG